MASQIKMVEVLAWSIEDVVKHTKEMLGTEMYNEVLMEWCVDGRELLKMKREDYCMLGVRNIGHLRRFLEFADNVSNGDNWQTKDQVNFAPTIIPSDKVVEICHDVRVSNPQQISSPGALPVAATFSGAPIFSAVNVISMVDPGVTYDRVFKSRPKGITMSGPNDIYGSKYLKRFHPLTLRSYNHNLAVVRSWFLDKTDLKIQKFYATNYRHDKEGKEALLAYIRSRYKEIGALSFNNGKSVETWQVEDIFEWFLENKHYVTGKKFSREMIGLTKDSDDGPNTVGKKRKISPLSQIISKTDEDVMVTTLCTEGSQYKFELWGLTKGTTSTKLSVRDKMCFHPENTISSLACIVDEVAQLWGYGTPLDLVRVNPYKVWKVKVFSKLPNSDFLLLPSGQQFKNYNRKIGGIYEGEVIEIPATYCRLTPAPDVSTFEESLQIGKLTMDLGVNPSEVKIDPNEKKVDYGVQTRRSTIKSMTFDPKCDKTMTPAIEAVTISGTVGIEQLSESDKLVVAQFVMDKQFKTEVYRDLVKWISSQNSLARKKNNALIFKGHKDLNKMELLTMIVKEALENRVKIVCLPEDWSSQGLCLHNICAL